MVKKDHEEIFEIRTLLGITQTDMANRLMISREHLSRMETGHTPITVTTLYAIRYLWSIKCSK